MVWRKMLRFAGWALAGGFVLRQAALGDMADGSPFATVLAALLGVALILVGVGSALNVDQTQPEEH